MQVKIPVKSPCLTADPSSCFQYCDKSSPSCTWSEQVSKLECHRKTFALTLALQIMQYLYPPANLSPGQGLCEIGGMPSDYKLYWGRLDFALMLCYQPENQIIVNPYSLFRNGVSDAFTDGMQFRIPFLELAVEPAYVNPSTHAQGAGPSLHGKECIDTPGPGGHWCYRLLPGDYLYNVSQNIPSLPMASWAPLCTPGVDHADCNEVFPLSSVEIPIANSNQCNPAKTCNVCAACCQSYIPEGTACDNCVADECK
jgi:hypothetical protein